MKAKYEGGIGGGEKTLSVEIADDGVATGEFRLGQSTVLLQGTYDGGVIKLKGKVDTGPANRGFVEIAVIGKGAGGSGAAPEKIGGQLSASWQQPTPKTEGYPFSLVLVKTESSDQGQGSDAKDADPEAGSTRSFLGYKVPKLGTKGMVAIGGLAALGIGAIIWSRR